MLYFTQLGKRNSNCEIVGAAIKSFRIPEKNYSTDIARRSDDSELFGNFKNQLISENKSKGLMVNSCCRCRFRNARQQRGYYEKVAVSSPLFYAKNVYFINFKLL